MESLTEATWDVVIHGTGLHQSLLALYANPPPHFQNDRSSD